jgi:hypothetical protein
MNKKSRSEWDAHFARKIRAAGHEARRHCDLERADARKLLKSSALKLSDDAARAVAMDWLEERGVPRDIAEEAAFASASASASTSASTITAHGLIEQFSDLRSLAPSFADWTEESFARDESRLFRLRRVAALFRAFDIPWNLPGFCDGEFLLRDKPGHAAIFARDGILRPEGASQVFSMLLGYRATFERALTFTRGWLVPGGGGMYFFRKTEEARRVLDDEVIAAIDDVLATFVCPEGKTFTVEELVRDFGYLDVDLFGIDADNW